MPPQASRWASQAALDSLLRFNPQRQSLAEQIREAQGQYGTTVRAGRTTARETEGSVQRALPLLQQAYSGANAAQQAGATLVSQGLANLPAADSQFKANQLAMGGVTVDNLAKASAAAQAQMLERGTRAHEGAQFNQLNAQQVLARTLQQLFSRGQSLAGEQGAFAQSEAEKLAHEAEDLEQRETASQRSAAVSERGQDLTRTSSKEGHDVTRKDAEEAHRNKHGKNETAPGVPEGSVDAHNKARDKIEAIRREAYEIRNEHQNYSTAKEDLEEAIPTKKGAPGRKAYTYNGLLKAGLDLAYFGAIGRGTMDLLHKEGLSLGKLGYPVYHAPRAGARNPTIATRRA